MIKAIKRVVPLLALFVLAVFGLVACGNTDLCEQENVVCEHESESKTSRTLSSTTTSLRTYSSPTTTSRPTTTSTTVRTSTTSVTPSTTTVTVPVSTVTVTEQPAQRPVTRPRAGRPAPIDLSVFGELNYCTFLVTNAEPATDGSLAVSLVSVAGQAGQMLSFNEKPRDSFVIDGIAVHTSDLSDEIQYAGTATTPKLTNSMIGTGANQSLDFLLYTHHPIESVSLCIK